MKQITASLAYSQLQQNRKRTVITIVGIALSVAMMTAVFGFALSGIEAMRRLVGDEDIRAYSSVLYSFAAVLGSIIMVASVVVISNAFRISAAERTRQFGILKSVGATKKQIVRTVLYEAAFLSAIAIPAGLLIGLLVQWLGSSIGDTLLAPMNKLTKTACPSICGLSFRSRFCCCPSGFRWSRCCYPRGCPPAKPQASPPSRRSA
jgi:putative ABC transport system permease protein